MRKLNFGHFIFSILSISIIIISYFILNSWYVKVRALYLDDVTNMIRSFIKENNGKFPKGRNDILIYGPDYKSKERIIDLYDIQYGADIDNLTLIDGILINLKTKQQVFLIFGKCPDEIKDRWGVSYEEASIQLYEEMLKYNKTKNSEKLEQ